MTGEQAENFPVEPKLEQDVAIVDDAEVAIEGRDIPEGQIVVKSIPEDEVTVNGSQVRLQRCVQDALSMEFQPQVQSRNVSSV